MPTDKSNKSTVKPKLPKVSHCHYKQKRDKAHLLHSDMFANSNSTADALKSKHKHKIRLFYSAKEVTSFKSNFAILVKAMIAFFKYDCKVQSIDEYGNKENKEEANVAKLSTRDIVIGFLPNALAKAIASAIIDDLIVKPDKVGLACLCLYG